jgi:hypothetical protein
MYIDYPIFKKAMELNVYIETIVRNFSRYHKYSIGAELRDKAREILYGIYKVYFSKDKKSMLEKLRDTTEEMKIIIYLAKELKAFKNFKQFEISSGIVFELSKQAQGWLRSLK